MFSMPMRAATWALAALIGLGAAAMGQTTAPAELSGDEERGLLDIRQAQLAVDQAQAEMDQAQIEKEQMESLFDEKLKTIDDLNKARQAYDRAVLKYEQAKIELRKTRLDFLKDATLITVVDARKYRGEEGEVKCSVRLRNDSNLGKARIAMRGAEGEEDLSEERLRGLLKVDNIAVTILGRAYDDATGQTGQKTIIGAPLRDFVPQLRLGEEAELEFTLVKRDVESVTVQLKFLGTVEEFDVFLQSKALEDLPVITSSQYSLHGQLGTKVRYLLELERLAKTEQSFFLAVLGLPKAIPSAIWDERGEAWLSDVRFSEEMSSQRLMLELSIPEKLDPALVDASLPFYFLAIRRSEVDKVNALRQKYLGQIIPPEEVRQLAGSSVELTVIPRGVGKLEILVVNTLKEVEQGKEFDLSFTVLNNGTLGLRNVTPKVEAPLEWVCELTPREAEELPPGQKALFKVHVRPPAEVEPGNYTVKVEAEGHSGIEMVEAPKAMNFEVKCVSKSNITGTVVLVVVLIVLVLGIAIASIKISRR